MATTVFPRIDVTTPPRSGRTGGLLAITQPIDITDAHAQNGVQYEADACALPDFAPGLCDDSYIPADLIPDEKDYGNGPEWTQSFPFALYVGYECWMPGDEYGAKALSILEAGETYGIERGLSVARFQSDDPIVIDGTFDLKHGIARLEQELGERYQGLGVIHMSREVASLALTGGSVDVDGSYKVATKQGVPVSNGSGYGVNGPEAVVPDDGSAWIFATGDVHVFRSPAETYTSDTPNKNTTDALAERVYNITLDCEFILAIQVTI